MLRFLKSQKQESKLVQEAKGKVPEAKLFKTHQLKNYVRVTISPKIQPRELEDLDNRPYTPKRRRD